MLWTNFSQDCIWQVIFIMKMTILEITKTSKTFKSMSYIQLICVAKCSRDGTNIWQYVVILDSYRGRLQYMCSFINRGKCIKGSL